MHTHSTVLLCISQVYHCQYLKKVDNLQMLECSSHAINFSIEMAISPTDVKNTLEDEGSHFLYEDLSNTSADQPTW